MQIRSCRRRRSCCAGRSHGRLPRTATTAATIGLALTLSACGASTSPSASRAPTSKTTTKSSSSPTTSTTVVENTGKCRPGATKLTFWAWVPGMARAVTDFNSTHPSVCVTMEDVGAGDGEYVKLADVLKAHSGAPDVAEIEYSELPNFEVTHSLVNLVPYGADRVKGDFASWAWSEVSEGRAVYGIPGDSGPVGLYYNAKLMAKYHLAIPTTWTQFAAEAGTFHRDDPSAKLTNFDATDIGWMLALMAQDSAFPFRYSGGAKVSIDFTGPKEMAFAAYWQKLITAHEVLTDTDGPVMWAAMNKSADATWLPAAWGPSYMAPAVPKTMGDWRAAPIPQWTPGADVQTNLGGSSYAVIKGSPHPKAAAEFAMWLNSTQSSWSILKTPPSSLFPTYLPLLTSASFKDLTYPISGTSHPNVAFTAAAKAVTPVEWPPFMTEVITEAGSVFSGTLDGKETLQQAFRTFQKTLVSYAKTEGFKVSA